MFKVVLATAVLLSGSAAMAVQKSSPKIQVRIDFVEALAPRDTTSSERFQRDYVHAILTAKSLTEKRLASCGYELKTETSFYDSTDPIQARETAAKSSAAGAWMIVGPRRSNHYLLLAQGSPETPTVSLMASAKEVGELGPLHQSISPLNSVMAKVAAKEAASGIRNKVQKTYFTVVNEDCVACMDFSASFDAHSKSYKLIKLGEARVSGDAPETSSLQEQIESLRPDIVLLPNYSKSAARVMAALEGSKVSPLFVGGDGWGDSKYGFVQNGEHLASATGITVRGLPPVEEGMKSFPLGKKLATLENVGVDTPWSGPGLAIVRLIDRTTDLLCQNRPKHAAGFRETFRLAGRKTYSAPWGVSVYRLKNGILSYQGMRKAQE